MVNIVPPQQDGGIKQLGGIEMETIHTIRIRQDWLDNAIVEAGGMANLAKKMDVTTSTVSRHANQRVEASPRFIGAVLTAFPIQFQDAFDVTEEQVRLRRARYVKDIVAA